MGSKSTFRVRLFYSYSHKDQRHRESLEKHLAVLRESDRVLSQWSDQNILPGQQIDDSIKQHINGSDIIVFLISADFLASQPCREEWEYARQAAKDLHLQLLPIIVRPCSWHDYSDMGERLALPCDGKPVSQFSNPDEAWSQVYDGIKKIVEQLKSTHLLRSTFEKEVERTDFASQDPITLSEIFVFPRISSDRPLNTNISESTFINSIDDLMASPHTLIHGAQRSGKTAVCRYLFLQLAKSRRPVLLVDLADTSHKQPSRVFKAAYERQFTGDYSLWRKQKDATIIFDHLTEDPHMLLTVQDAVANFGRVLLSINSDIYFAFFRDDTRMASFSPLEIRPLSREKQESLIRKRAELLSDGSVVEDAKVDQLERRVNEIVISNRILPRYPFYILTILQTYEGFMPINLPLTAYGHCYHILIISQLMKSGIAQSDDEIDTCFNFAEQLALEIFENRRRGEGLENLVPCEFIKKYREEFIITDSTLHRLFSTPYGLLQKEGSFRNDYVYYYFLGRLFARKQNQFRKQIEECMNDSHRAVSFLILMFTIHHTTDTQLLDDIVERNKSTFTRVNPVLLDSTEADNVTDLIEVIPQNVLSLSPVRENRSATRRQEDHIDDHFEEELDESSTQDEDTSTETVNKIYRILKSNQILGLILRNKYGSIERTRIREIVETVSDSALRLVRLLLDHESMRSATEFIHEKEPDIGIDRIRKWVAWITFGWTIANLQQVSNALNKGEIRDIVNEVVAARNSPAYDLIGYFVHLDSLDTYTRRDVQKIRQLIKKHDSWIFSRLLSIKTQLYLNSHTMPSQLEQSTCAALDIQYRPRMKQ